MIEPVQFEPYPDLSPSTDEEPKRRRARKKSWKPRGPRKFNRAAVMLGYGIPVGGIMTLAAVGSVSRLTTHWLSCACSKNSNTAGSNCTEYPRTIPLGKT